MATSSSPIATCVCRHTCDIAPGFVERGNSTTSTNATNEVPVGQGNENETGAKLLKYQEENIRLRSVIHDVTEVNKRWQKYNQERVGYVQKLLTTIRELQQKEAIVREEAVVCARQEHVHAENTVLRKELDECEKSYRHLNTKMNLAKHDFVEQLQVLEMQMKMHKDDWEAEKREKEEATRTSEKFKQEVEALKLKQSDVQNQVSQPKSTVVYVCVCKNYTNDTSGFGCRMTDSLMRQNLRNDTIHVLPCQNIMRPSPPSSEIEITQLSPPHHSPFSRKSGGGRSSPSSSSSASSSPSSSSSSSVNSSPQFYVDSTTDNYNVRVNSVASRLDGRVKSINVKCAAPPSRPATWKLICPKCRRVFPSNLHLQFTSHIDQCQENMHTCSQ